MTCYNCFQNVAITENKLQVLLKSKKPRQNSAEPKSWLLYAVRQVKANIKVWLCQFDHQTTNLRFSET